MLIALSALTVQLPKIPATESFLLILVPCRKTLMTEIRGRVAISREAVMVAMVMEAETAVAMGPV